MLPRSSSHSDDHYDDGGYCDDEDDDDDDDDGDDADDDDDNHAIVLLHHRPIVVDTIQKNINQHFEPGWLCQLYQCTVEQMMFLDVFIFMPRHSGGKGGGENMQKI